MVTLSRDNTFTQTQFRLQRVNEWFSFMPKTFLVPKSTRCFQDGTGTRQMAWHLGISSDHAHSIAILIENMSTDMGEDGNLLAPPPQNCGKKESKPKEEICQILI
jgi:hypothetical protein